MIRPSIFGKFCLLERVNVGGMAELYRAKLLNSPNFDGYIAIKRILPNLADDEEFITMFFDEAHITVEMAHPSICQVFELGRLQDIHYMAMEFIVGRDLEQIQTCCRRQDRPMDPTQAAFIIAQVALGLDFAHSAVNPNTGQPLHIVHRDVSPQNILVSYDGAVKLIDFGVAKAATKNSKTPRGALKGKHGYMSPEQAEGVVTIDHRSDIFALGTLFWECLTGRRLFQGDNDFVTLGLVGECNVEPPSKHNPDVPPELEAICMRALKKDRHFRYQRAGDMGRDLWTCINSQEEPYTPWHLQQWMHTHFLEELEKEHAKLSIFQSIKTLEDVESFDASQVENIPENASLPSVILPPAETPRSAWPIVLLLLLVLGGAGAAAYVFLFNNAGDAATQTASPTLLVKPSDPRVTITVAREGTPIGDPHTGPQQTLTSLEPGLYTVTATHPRYEDVSTELSFKPGEHEYVVTMLKPKPIYVPLVLKLTPTDATATLTSLADSQQVELQAAEVAGERRAELLLGSSYELKAQLPGYAAVTLIVTVGEEDEQGIYLDITLEKATGTVTINSVPPEGTVFRVVDGQETPEALGPTPQTLKGLDPALTHVFEVRLKGYQPQRVDVSFKYEDLVEGKNEYAKSLMAFLKKL